MSQLNVTLKFDDLEFEVEVDYTYSLKNSPIEIEGFGRVHAIKDESVKMGAITGRLIHLNPDFRDYLILRFEDKIVELAYEEWEHLCQVAEDAENDRKRKEGRGKGIY